MTKNLPVVISREIQPYGIKDFEYVRDQLTKSAPVVYELTRPSFEFDNASKYHRVEFYSADFGGAVVTALAAIGTPFLSGGLMLAGIGFTALTCGLTVYSHLLYSHEYKNHHSIGILKKLNIRPSLAKVTEDNVIVPVNLYIDLLDRIKIISDLEQLREQENEGLPIVTGGRIIFSSGNHYRFEKDGKESGFECSTDYYSHGGETVRSKLFNISKHVTPCSQDELKAYLDARMKAGDDMLIGGKVVNGSLQADLFRDENNKGAFDIYLKKVA